MSRLPNPNERLCIGMPPPAVLRVRELVSGGLHEEHYGYALDCFAASFKKVRARLYGSK